MCRAYGALLCLAAYPALTRWANFSARLRRCACKKQLLALAVSKLNKHERSEPKRARRLLWHFAWCSLSADVPQRAGAGVLLESYKEFWPVAMSQHTKLNMAGFVLYLLGGFALRCGQHPALSSQRSAKTNINSVLPQRTRRQGGRQNPTLAY